MGKNKLTLENFQNLVPPGEKLSVIKFSSTTCMPCKTMQPVWEHFKKNNSDKKLYEVDVGVEPEIAGFFNVRSVPTIVYIEGQNPLYHFVGVTPLRDLQYVLDNINDPYFRTHGEFKVEKKKDHFFTLVVILLILLFLGLFIFL